NFYASRIRLNGTEMALPIHLHRPSKRYLCATHPASKILQSAPWLVGCENTVAILPWPKTTITYHPKFFTEWQSGQMQVLRDPLHQRHCTLDPNRSRTTAVHQPAAPVGHRSQPNPVARDRSPP